MTTKQIVLASRPKGLPTKENFKTETIDVHELQDDEVLIKALYFSVDPYMRGRMNEGKSYTPPYDLNKPLTGAVVGEIVESKSDSFSKGDIVTGVLPWAENCIATASSIKKIDTSLAPKTYFLGLLGMPGLTAYFGLIEIGIPKYGETVVVSGAAGAVGVVVAQIAKLKGCRVVGIAGSDQKIDMLKTEFGIDEGINYKSTDNIKDAIKKTCPDGVDIYFDNVGGEISDAVIDEINLHARIIICGQISLYNATEPPVGPRMQPMLLKSRSLMQGFLIGDFKSSFSEGIQQLSQWVKEDKLHYKETIIDGFDNLPDALIGLFSGENIGKMIVKA